MKLKQLPSDFIVEEVSDIKISDKGQYKIYLVEKEGIESFELMRYLGKKFNIPFAQLGIAGLKDKHALTRQYLTIPARYDISELQEPHLKVKKVGFVNEALTLGDLKGNHFMITARNIMKGEIDGVKQKAENVPSMGVPNYFDSQRFGSLIDGDFIMKKVMQHDYEAAVKIFLTRYSRHESANAKAEKRALAADWADLSKVRVNNGTFRNIITVYLKTKDWCAAYKEIPGNLREMYVSAYQSYIWNECVKYYLRKLIDNKSLYNIEYAAGNLLFYKRLSEAEQKNIPSTFVTLCESTKLDGLVKEVVDKVLSKEGITLKDFDIKKETGNFFKEHDRSFILKPTDFKITGPEIDEQNDRGKGNRFKYMIEFTLPKGSYATVVTKRLLNQ